MVAQIRHGARFARLHPAAAWAWIPFDSTLVTEPQLHRGIRRPTAQAFQKGLSFLLILAFGPGSGKAQVKVQLVQPADRGAITQVHAELFLEVAMHFDPSPVDHPSLRRIFQHGHEQIAHALQLHLARTMTGWLRAERINPTPIEQFNPQPHHAIGAGAERADLRAGETQQQRAQGL